ITGIDLIGDQSTTSASVTVGSPAKPSVGLSVDNDRPAVNTAVTFTVTANVPNTVTTNDAIQNTHLDYGDGSSVDLGSAATSSPKHTYTSSGPKIATATTVDTNGATATAQVTVNVQ